MPVQTLIPPIDVVKASMGTEVELKLVAPPRAMRDAMQMPWLRKLGVVAYGTYLIHQPVSGLVFGFARGHWPYIASGSDLLLIALALAITLGLAALSWRWFEKPIVDLGRRWDYEVLR